MLPRPLRWYKSYVQRLTRVDEINKPTLLHELYISLLTSTYRQIAEIAPPLPLQNIFDCLNTDNSEQIHSALKVLEYMFTGLEPSSILLNYGDNLTKAIQHPQNEIKEFVLDELKKMMNHDAASTVYARTDLLALVVDCINDHRIGVADRAMCLLKTIGKDHAGLLVLYSEPILTAIFDILTKKDDTIRLRMYEVLIDICFHSATLLGETNSRHLLDGLVTTLKEGDVLTKLCVLEEITRLGSTPHGYNYLVDNGYLKMLFSQVRDYIDPTNTILLKGIFGLFAAVARNEPSKVFFDHAHIVTRMFSLIKSNSERLQHIGLKTVGYIGETDNGKLALAEHSEAVEDMLDTICHMINHDNFVSRGIALDCVSCLMKVDEKNQNEEIVKLTEDWFKHILPVFRTLMELCTNSVDQMNISALSVLDSLARLDWGQQLIAKVAGCAEVLTSRENYVSSMDDVRYLKCNILKSLVLSENAEKLFPVDLLRRFHVFISSVESKTTASPICSVKMR